MLSSIAMLPGLNLYAHELDEAHEDRDLSHEEARALGFEVKQEDGEWQDTSAPPGNESVRYPGARLHIRFPARVGDYPRDTVMNSVEPECTALRAEEMDHPDGTSETDLIVTYACTGLAHVTAIYGSYGKRPQVFYFITYEP
jgi:hypothetical protein